MTNNEFVEKLYKKEGELIKIINYHGVYGDKTNDFLQFLYLKLLEFSDINRYVNNNEPNMYIIFIILRNLIYDDYKNKYIIDENEVIFNLYNNDENENENLKFLYNEINNISSWFDKNIIELYIYESHSIRSLAKATNIGRNYIQPIVTNFKKSCIEKYKKSKK